MTGEMALIKYRLDETLETNFERGNGVNKIQVR